jgi:hypothetical protein
MKSETAYASESSRAQALLDLLADPTNLSSREIPRRTGLDHRYIGGYRTALAAAARGPEQDGQPMPSALGTTPAPARGSVAAPPSGTRSTPGHTIPFEPPALNSYDCWALATDDERRRFVDAVGLRNLYRVAPPDHRAAFRRELLADDCANALTAVPSTWKPSGDGADMPPIPEVLQRRPAYAAGHSGAREPASAEAVR